MSRRAKKLYILDTIRCQKRQINTFRVEKDGLTSTLKMCESRSCQKKNQRKAQEMQTHRKDYDIADKELARRRQRIAQLEEEAFSLEKALAKKILPVKETEKRSVHSKEKATEIVTNTLSHTLEKACCQVSKNSRLKEEVYSLRVQKHHFQENYCKMAEILQAKKKEIDDTIQLTLMLHKTEMEMHGKVHALEKSEVKYAARHATKVKILLGKVNHIRQMKAFRAAVQKRRKGTISYDTTTTTTSSDSKADIVEVNSNLIEIASTLETLLGAGSLGEAVSKFRKFQRAIVRLFDSNKALEDIEVFSIQKIKDIQGGIDRLSLERLSQTVKYKDLMKEMTVKKQRSGTKVKQIESDVSSFDKSMEEVKARLKTFLCKNDCNLFVSSPGIAFKDLHASLMKLERKITEMKTIAAFIKGKGNLDQDVDDLLSIIFPFEASGKTSKKGASGEDDQEDSVD